MISAGANQAGKEAVKYWGNPPQTYLDKMAFDGMRFWSAYAEPSCTPARIALNTGRHPVLTGVNGVMWPGNMQDMMGAHMGMIRKFPHRVNKWKRYEEIVDPY